MNVYRGLKVWLRTCQTLLASMGVLITSGCSEYRPFEKQAVVRPADEASYTVRYGDTLGKIAKRHNITLDSLAAANDLAPPYVIYADSTLLLPRGISGRNFRPSPKRPLNVVAQPRLDNCPATTLPQLRGPVSSPIEGDCYVVGPGESLSTIASKNDLTLAELVAVNAIEPPYHINPGQRLIIPASELELQQRARVVNEVRRQQAIDAAPSAPLSSDGFLWPVEGPLIRTFKENSAAGQSGAVNIDARVGTPVRATNNGIVAFVGEPLPRYGQMIVLRHAEGYVSLYAHTGVPLVEQGDSVSRGQVLTDVSSSGDVDEGQLRFELRKGLEPIDPVRVLAGLPSHKARSL